MTSLYEILVPTVYRLETKKDGTPKYYKTRFHKTWDAKVRAITGGLTIMPPAKGQWVSPDNELFLERVIPVRIVATREQMDEIVDLTMIMYDQLAILAYRISDEVILKHRT